MYSPSSVVKDPIHTTLPQTRRLNIQTVFSRHTTTVDMAKQGKKGQSKPQPKRQQKQSTRPSGPSTLTAPRLNLASNAGRQSEIALPVRKGSQTLVIHPDNTRWLGEAAPSFQRWGMSDMILSYVPRVSTSMNGQVALTFLSDYADLSPNSLEDTVSLSGSHQAAPWSRFQLPKIRNRLFDYCSLRDFEAGDATTKNDRSPGRIVVFADMDASFPQDDVVGWVYIAYTPVLQQPILRRLQQGGAGGGSGGDGPSGAYTDYYYHIQDYSNKYDFLGMNSERDPSHLIQLTARLWYVYNPEHNMCMVVNASDGPVNFYAEVFLKNVSVFGSANNIVMRQGHLNLFPGDKGEYAAFTKDDCLFRMVGEIEKGGWFGVDNSAIVTWSRSEMYMYEIGQEYGPVTIPRQIGGIASEGLGINAVRPEQVAAAQVKYSPSFSLNAGVTTRKTNYVGLPVFSDTAVEVLPGLKLHPNGASSPASFGATAPTNRLGYLLQNTTTAAMNLHISQIGSAFVDKYATTLMNATLIGSGTIFDNYTSGNFNNTTVQLAPGSSVYWVLTLRSSTLADGTSAVESVGTLYMTVSQSSSPWPTAPVAM
uniref:Capsid protein n=1 Tax=Plasmopara viticola lesion associated tombus-like virus 2 TaxID=2770119 RepID=A0A6B9Q733_9TOMB|nr:VC [Plasmopara viticola lesion associated tombus-like virus 2]